MQNKNKYIIMIIITETPLKKKRIQNKYYTKSNEKIISLNRIIELKISSVKTGKRYYNLKIRNFKS